MRNLLAFTAALALTVAGVGLYLDWYRVRTTSPGAGRRTVNIDINTEKISDDLREGGEYLLEQGGEKIQEILERRRRSEAEPQRAEGTTGTKGTAGGPDSPPPPKRPSPPTPDDGPRRTGTVLPPFIVP
ncbi:MAG TPA: hypothetical protein VNK04_00760 [Gemmataceae bacterium]|nr:hypothetical protein [Gemmataceae bacterium]